jgi:hypothetical protein
MAKIPLTPQQKQDKRLRDQLIFSHNQVISAWGLEGLRTWEGVYRKLGYGQEYITQHPELKKGELTYAELKDFLQRQKDQLELDIAKNHLEYTKAVEAKQQREQAAPVDVTPVDRPLSKFAKTDQAAESLVKEMLDKAEQDELKQEVKEQVKAKKEEPSSSNNYGLVPSPNEKCNFFWFQKKAIADAWDKLYTRDLPSVLIISGTGTGKTWMVGGILRRFADIEYHIGKTFSHIPYLYVTKASIVTQTERVLERDFNLGIEDLSVINVEQLRSTAGKFWLKRELVIVEGEETEKWTWKKNVQPAVIEWDENQVLKNPGSLQHNIACALNDMGKFQPKQIFSSATPFTKVSEAKCWAVSTHKSLEYINGQRSGFPAGSVLTNETWPAYAKAIAYPSAPDEYNEAAVERLMSDLEDYVVRVKGVRPQFEAENDVQMIDFQTQEEADFYHKAWERYLEQKAKLEAMGMGGVPVGMALLVQFLKFRMAAEYCRRNYLVDRMIEIVEGGKAAVCALSFKQTIIAMVMEFEKRGIKRHQISIIWGGGQTGLTDKQKAKAKIKSLTPEQLEAQGVTQEELLENLDLEDVEDREIIDLPEHLRLGMQSFEERQREIDKFQRGETLYCIYTLKAGGVGLSLHHTDELTKFKCRRKESGYVVEEDIPKVPTRPREVLVTPTWSPIELVQGVGRAPRLTSLSTTKQHLIFYRGTIEGRVADIAGRGLRCLSKIIKQRESWSDLVVKGKDEDIKKYEDTLPEDNEDSGMIDEGGDEE